jgi:hypothetical protein
MSKKKSNFFFIMKNKISNRILMFQIEIIIKYLIFFFFISNYILDFVVSVLSLKRQGPRSLSYFRHKLFVHA